MKGEQGTRMRKCREIFMWTSLQNIRRNYHWEQMVQSMHHKWVGTVWLVMTSTIHQRIFHMYLNTLRLRTILLPPAYVVWREGTVFTGVCLLTFRGGTPSQVWVGGVPHLRSGGYPMSRGYPMSGAYPIYGGVPHVRGGTPSPGPPIAQSSIASTCYAAGGLPLAFTQEDFLVPSCFEWLISEMCDYTTIQQKKNWKKNNSSNGSS